jgi:hypothetical protein
MHSTSNPAAGASQKRTRTFEDGHFFQLNENLIRWRLVLSHVANAVYDLLAFRIDRKTQQWSMSQPRMAEQLGVSERWVRKGLEELESFALIEVRRQSGGQSHYRMLEVSPYPGTLRSAPPGTLRSGVIMYTRTKYTRTIYQNQRHQTAALCLTCQERRIGKA